MNRTIAALASALCLTATLAWAHGKATGIVRERMDQMVTLKDTMKLLKAELSKGEAYDRAAVLNAAATIKEHSGDALTVKFPEGSLTKHSEALPSVWQEPDRFADLAQQMARLSDALTASVEAGVPNIPTNKGLFTWLSGEDDSAGRTQLRSPFDNFGAIGDTCRTCHDDFRKK